MKSLATLVFITLSISLFSQQDKISKYGLKIPTKEQLDSMPTEIFRPKGLSSIEDIWDLTRYMPTPGHQGTQNSCTAWAVGYGLKSYQERIETGRTLLFSPSFIFNSFPNDEKCKTGLFYWEALNHLRDKGICELSDMPYSEDDCSNQPSHDIENEALIYKIEDWKPIYKSINDPIDDISEIKAKIYNGYPVAIAVWLDSQAAKFIDNLKPNKPKFVWKNPLKDTVKSKSYHAMLCVGYDDYDKEFKVLNSYGPNSGNNGYLYISYDAFKQAVYEAYYVIDSNNDGNYVYASKSSKQQPTFAVTNTSFNFYGWLKQGYYIQISDKLKLSCAYLKKSKDIVILRVYDTTKEKEKLIGSYKFNSGDSYEINYLGISYILKLDKIGGAGYNIFKSAAFIYFSSELPKHKDEN